MRTALCAAAIWSAVGCARGDRSGAQGATTDAPGAAGGSAFRPLAVGDVAPAYAAPTLGGDTVKVGSAGPVTLVNVWATWCTSCREEMADLEALHRELSPRGLRVLAVSVDQGDGTRVRRFVEHERLTFAVGLDPENRVQEAFRVVGVPESFLIGRDGRVLWHQLGGLHGAAQAARAAAERALEQSAVDRSKVGAAQRRG